MHDHMNNRWFIAPHLNRPISSLWFFMKKQLLILITLVLSAGCAAVEVERNVADNVFHSSYPALSLAVAPEFQYVGHTKTEKMGKSINGNPLKHKRDYYIFIQSDQSNKIQKCVIVEFHWIATHFISDFYRNVKNKLEAGVYNFNDEEYQYYTRIFNPSPT